MTDTTPAASQSNRRALVHNAITNALSDAGDWVPLNVRIAATRAALAEVDAWHEAEPAVSSAVVAPPTDQTTPSHRAGLRDEIVNALGRITTTPPVAHRRAQADHVLAVLYREWPWLRAEAEDAAPTDHTTPPAWVDGHPQLEAIAAAVWEQCGRSDNGACVDDDPRNIAVAALSAVRNTADDQAAENKRLRAKVFEWQGSYLDEVKVRQERDAEIARLRADRAAVLRWAADRIDATRADFPIAVQNGITWATAEMRRHAADEQPGARHVHITIHHPDPTTAHTAALCIADLVRGEYGDSLRLTITTDAPGTGAAPHRQADETATETPDDTQTLLFWDEANAVTATDGRITIPLTRAVNLAQPAPAGHLILQLPTAAALRTALVKALMDNHDTESDTDCCGAEPPQDGTWGDCWCTLPPDHDGEHRCQPCTTRHGAPGWTDEPAAGARQDGAPADPWSIKYHRLSPTASNPTICICGLDPDAIVHNEPQHECSSRPTAPHQIPIAGLCTLCHHHESAACHTTAAARQDGGAQ
jgi:hypothetical protein